MLTIKQKKQQKTSLLTILRALNLSKAELARYIDVDRSMITRWMNGEQMISALSAFKLSEIFPELKPQEISPAFDKKAKYTKK